MSWPIEYGLSDDNKDISQSVRSFLAEIIGSMISLLGCGITSLPTGNF